MLNSAAIESGENYLLERLRAREVVSRAPETCPDKRWDDCGEPYLAIDVLLALGDRTLASDRQELAGRLLASQFRGAWDYGEKRGIDADTTASAIRALDRLVPPVPLDGLKSFYNSRYQLFNTFPAPPEDKLGLQLPPQSARKHLGCHPCVIGNICLLLHERKQLSRVSHDLLRQIQKPDGSWQSYFYPSPYYSTRLYTELLTAMGEEYDGYMTATENNLVTSAPSQSPSRAAEILISLSCLRARKGADRARIGRAGQCFAEKILSAQLADGSWPGEDIWHYLHRELPYMIIGFDHFRVRSTALCVRALKLWL
jgi:hypothetical protein